MMNNNIDLDDIVISSFISLKRNLRNYPFTEKMSGAQKCELLSNLMQYISSKARLLPVRFTYNEPALLSENELDSYIEKNLADGDIKEQTEGKGIFTAKNEKLSVIINNGAHITIKSSVFGFDLEAAYKKALSVDNIICDELPLAFSETYGYLFSDEYKCGTGLEASMLIHLPFLELTQELTRYADNMKKFGINIEKFGEFGGLYTVKNTLSVGISENECIKNLNEVVKMLVSEEKSLREELKNNTELLQSMIISVETLKNAMEISYDQLLEHISIIRAGVAEGLILGIDISEINRYMDILGDAAIAVNYSDEDIDKRRAKLIKSLFEKVYY